MKIEIGDLVMYGTKSLGESLMVLTGKIKNGFCGYIVDSKQSEFPLNPFKGKESYSYVYYIFDDWVREIIEKDYITVE